MAQIFPIDFEEKLTMAQDDYILFSDSEDGNKIKKAQYSNLKGEKGDTGATGPQGPQGIQGIQGPQGEQGPQGASVVSAEFSGDDIVFALDDLSSVTLENAKTELTGPQGEKGDTGTAATIAVGTTTTGNPGTDASVTNSGTSSAAVFDFTIPKGDKGDTGNAATVSVGTTTTGQPGTSASVTNSGTSSAAVFDFVIPEGEKGDKGDTGNTGATGNGISTITETTSGKVHTITITETDGDTTVFTVSDGADGEGAGDVVGPNGAVDGNVALFDGNTGKLIKDGGALPSVINNLTSVSTTDALSAAQGKALKDAIDNISGLGKFLSLWDCTTGQPISFPLSTPYTYTTGDRFMVETVGTTNYKPNGSSYTGTASTTVETETVEQGDVYIYDGSTWLLQKNTAVEVSFSAIAGQPTDNAALSTALGNKQDKLVSGTNIKTVNSTSLLGSGNIAVQETLVSGTNIKTVNSTSLLGSGDIAVQPTLVSGTNIKTVNSTSLLGSGNVAVQPTLESGTNIKTVNGNSILGSGNLSLYSTITVTLTSAGWSNNEQTVSATGVTASNTVIVSPAPANINDYASNSVYCSAQGSGTLTFSCNTEPTVDIVVNILTIN